MEALLNKIYRGIEPDESKGLEILVMGRRPPRGLIDAGYGRNSNLNDEFGNSVGDGDGDCDCCDCDDCCDDCCDCDDGCCECDSCCECDDPTDCFCCCG